MEGATYYKLYYHLFDPDCFIDPDSGKPSFQCSLLAGDLTETRYNHADPNPFNNFYWVVACNDAGCSDIDTDNPAKTSAG